MLSPGLFQSAFESAHCATVITDVQSPDNPIVYVNPTFTAQTGYALDEVVGKNCRFLQGKGCDPNELKKIRTALKEGTSTIALLSNYRKDGSQFWNELHISPIRDEEGTVTHFVGVQYDITQRVHAEQDLKRLATTDYLTGTFNRRYFFEACERELNRAQRYSHPTTVLMVDIDQFKNINDTHGHAAGDEALVCFSATCRDLLRGEDILGRFGGEEFAILLPETDKTGAAQVAERLRARIEKVQITNEKHAFQFTVSIGAALCSPADDSVKKILDRADQALYEAKSAGRNRVVWAKDSLATSAAPL